ncbi:MAG: 2-phosphosulfolactate phosphatase [Oscillospiraceae bacterium]|jgi:2-phosphosulfolactate phosphatase|nr:2-phosphosulfolactate phosphatase [Oscillospiraceae bacterium]
MRLNLIFSADKCEEKHVAGRAAIVIDVLRATSVIISALANGAECVTPCKTVEEARALALSGRSGKILGGERRADKIPGFDCGNSPLEYTRERVGGKEIILTSSNGTKAVKAAAKADRLYIMALLNHSAVAEKVLSEGKDAVLVCAGTDGEFSLEDALCASLFINACAREAKNIILEDAALFAKAFGGHIINTNNNIYNLLRNSMHVSKLESLGYKADIEFCLKENVFDIIPELHGGKLFI